MSLARAMTNRIAVLHNEAAAHAPADERDVLVQVDAVREALRRRNIEPTVVSVDLDLARLASRLDEIAPDLVINLVESLGGTGRLAHAVPALLEHMGLPFTGAGSSAMLLTTNKLLAKQWLAAHGIPTPAILGEGVPCDARVGGASWIVKSVWEDASVGLDDDSVAVGAAKALELLARHNPGTARNAFAERFVTGREVNVALLADGDGVHVLAPAEICFEGWPAGKPRIVGYRAKWEPDSFECRGTVRRPMDLAGEPALAARLHDLAGRCWRIFGLRGYARVDFRVDDHGDPWVLEINANPCLSPDAGFAAALAEAGLGIDEALVRIVAAARLAPGYTASHD